jgi:acetyltransferase-like isoleucine patch superfamily enzyme
MSFDTAVEIKPRESGPYAPSAFRDSPLRRLFDAIADWIVAPLALSYALRRRMIGRERAYLELSERAARWPGMRGQRMRRALHRRMGTPIGEAAVLHFGVILERPPLSIGRMAGIGHYAHLQHVKIGDNALIGDFVVIVDGRRQHNIDRLDVPINEQGGLVVQTQIGDDVLIGAHSVILADVGDHCVVGAGSVVVEPVAAYKIVAGNPARVIGDRRDRFAV